MNKRAKKRLKDSLEKGNVEKARLRNEKNLSAPKDLQVRPGFTQKPAKKKG